MPPGLHSDRKHFLKAQGSSTPGPQSVLRGLMGRHRLHSPSHHSRGMPTPSLPLGIMQGDIGRLKSRSQASPHFPAVREVHKNRRRTSVAAGKSTPVAGTKARAAPDQTEPAAATCKNGFNIEATRDCGHVCIRSDRSSDVLSRPCGHLPDP